MQTTDAAGKLGVFSSAGIRDPFPAVPILRSTYMYTFTVLSIVGLYARWRLDACLAYLLHIQRIGWNNNTITCHKAFSAPLADWVMRGDMYGSVALLFFYRLYVVRKRGIFQ